MIQRVLVIDDSETDQFICSCVLEEHNESIEIIKAYDGKEGLEILATLDKHPELILLDINMPRMNGHEFLEEYHATYDNPTSVVVMLTSSSQLQDKEEAMRYAFVKEYQQKPLSADAVLRLETVLSI
jgi:CheY-like chemotaxis protein